MNCIWMPILVFASTLFLVEAQNYCWTDYNGTIPHNAVKAGNNTYVAQGFLFANVSGGNLPAGISPGDQAIKLSVSRNDDGTLVTATRPNIKILTAGPSSNLKWFTTTHSTFLFDVLGKNLVIGGGGEAENGDKTTNYIGRYQQANGEIVVGRIRALRWSNVWFNYLSTPEDKLLISYDFDVLIEE